MTDRTKMHPIRRLALVALDIEGETRGRRHDRFSLTCYVSWRHIEELRSIVADITAAKSEATQ